MKRIEFLGTDKEVLEFLNVKKFDYETDYTNASVNVRLFGSHGKCNVPIGFSFYKMNSDDLSIVSMELDEYIQKLEDRIIELEDRIIELEKENAELKNEKE